MDKDFIERAHLHLAKIKNSLLSSDLKGEEITNSFSAARVPLNQIKEDPEFQNARQKVDPGKYEILKASIHQDGLKTPIVVRAGDGETDTQTVFRVRAGFRRLRAVRELGWDRIPAIIIPCDTPDIEDYWINLSENCQRESITPFEIACQARLLVTKHGATVQDIARRTSLSAPSIADYIRFLQYLPDEIITAWKEGNPLLDRRYLSRLASMAPWAASADWRRRLNKLPLETSLTNLSTRKVRRIKIASFELMQDIHHYLAVERTITHEARDLALRCLEICMGARPVIPGIWPPRQTKRIMSPRYWPEGLDLPDQGDDIHLPSENGKPAFAMTDDEPEPQLSTTRKGRKR